MHVDAALYGIGILIIGFLPYKLIQKFQPRGLNAANPPTAFLLGAWFFGLSSLLFIKTHGLVVDVSLPVLALFISVIGVWLFAHRIVRIIGTPPAGYFDEHPTSFVVRFARHLVYLKFFEILFQQATFSYVLHAVLEGLAGMLRIFLFTVIIGAIHALNILFLPRREALTFFSLSIPMAIVFGILILNGYILVAMAIHLWFYLLYYGRLWIHSNVT